MAKGYSYRINQDSASFIHAMQAGLYLFNSLMNLRKHQDGLPIVNLRLALLLIPPMIAANNLGTLLKYVG